MRNIVDARNKGQEAARSSADAAEFAPDAAESGRDAAGLRRELLGELTAWPAGDRGGAFKAWHRHALSLVHLNVLTLIEADGPLPMRRLAESMDVSDASATGIVDRMEKRGLVERRRDSADRRVVLVHPTDTGRRVFEDMAARRRERLSAVLNELSENDMASLLSGMHALHAARQRVMAALAGAPATPGDESKPPQSAAPAPPPDHSG